MMLYRSVFKEASVEQVIERSRFIAHIRPVESREEAETFFSRIRTEHKGATHNVPAFVFGAKGEHQWASDDGEPQGTAGAPMLQLLIKEDLANVAVIVTRYFGGTKLGTGGLARAYTSSAKLAIEASGICRVMEVDVICGRLEYSHFERLKSTQDEVAFQIREVNYADRVTVTILVDPEKRKQLEDLIAELTGGSFQPLSLQQERVKIS
ncbi:MAG: YigZ family protein [Firmicutes bacterium HGW-Firmicutes-11]|jgi:uncharacterized YigZ family protein|nr:MAG: YigZ family protein [Firmicutes bacterium HGW-Firmicutes-11]